MPSIEQVKFKEMAACAVTLGALASLQACEAEAPKSRHEQTAIEEGDRPDLQCTGAGLFTDYGSGNDVLKVHVINNKNRRVNVDTAVVRELGPEIQRERQYDLARNETDINLSKHTIQLVVKVEKDGHAFACPTDYYPNRR